MSIETQVQTPEQPQTVQYEAPQIESVITPDEIKREVAYAGAVAPSSCQYEKTFS